MSMWGGFLGGGMRFGVDVCWLCSGPLGLLFPSLVAGLWLFKEGGKSELGFSSRVMDLCLSFALRSGVRSRRGRSQLLILGDSAAGLTSTVEYLDGEETDNESSEEIGVPDDEALWRFVFERRLLRRPVTSR